jgi:ribonucleases P/MRP protein subunit RPP40
VIPLFKKGNRSNPAAYRPISLCSCIGKILEKVSQYGFRHGRSTVGNLLACDAATVKFLDRDMPYDVISFDYQRAFDKVPHSLLIESISELNVHPVSLSWFASFFQGRTQQVIVDGTASSPAEVRSGVVQGSVMGPTCFCIYIDSLLEGIRRLIGPNGYAFADDFKFVSGTSPGEHSTAQSVVSYVDVWSKEHRMPLSFEKCGVLHCGKSNPQLPYYIEDRRMLNVNQFKDLGVIRELDAFYSHHVNGLAAKYARLCGSVLRVFRTREPALLWTAYQAYIKPKIMYAASVWSPNLQQDIQAVERVQRHLTKKLAGMSNMSYEQRLCALHALSLKDSRYMADMILIHKGIHGKTDFKLSDIGVELSINNERSGKLRLQQSHHASRVSKGMFAHRAATEWNNLPAGVAETASLSAFKSKLRAHLSSQYNKDN